jgi:hypothetical protein
VTASFVNGQLFHGGRLIDSPRVELQIAHASQLAATLRFRGEQIDALITDTPYSERTHQGHNDLLIDDRRPVTYDPWTAKDVASFVEDWAPLTRGWFVTITDHVLVPAWEKALRAADRYVFAPLPLVVIASRLRMRGDGPSPWSYQVIVARPRHEPFSSWGTLRGAYVGNRERLHMAGGKPLWAMLALVGDYSRTGDLVCDPCCGAGTTLLAALRLGRSAIGSDSSAVAAGIAEDRLLRELERAP